MNPRMNLIGQPINRTDGRLKVTGGALYAADHPVPDAAHAVLVLSTVASGRIRRIDAAAAEKMPGVLLVMSHLNAPRLPEHGQAGAGMPPAGRILSLLQDDLVHYNRQPVAVVVAETLEQACDAASRLHIEYERGEAVLDFEQAKQKAYSPGTVKNEKADSLHGNLQAGLRDADAQIDLVYRTPHEHHNPMEPHATIAVWQGGRLTLYDSTQYVSGDCSSVARRLGIAPDRVRVICPHVGGGFGCKGSSWSHVALAAMAARQAGRPVKLVLERPQMFGPVGQRPQTEQHLTVAARSDGRLTALRHDVIAYTSFIEDWIEGAALSTRMLYACPNILTTHRLARLHLPTPTFMRAPGEASGLFALESALDEMAYELGIDPLRLRLQNYAESNANDGKPWSGKSLRECYQLGAERFGWARRNPQPRSMRAGRKLVGLGMASATYPANRQKALAAVAVLPDGSAVVRSGTQDLGTGTYTVMTQVAAEVLGLPVERVRVELGDSDLPQAPVSGGSQTVASVAPAVEAAAQAARARLVGMAIADAKSPLHGLANDAVALANGWLASRADSARREPVEALLARHGGRPVEALAGAEPGAEKKQYSMHSFGSVFTEVRVDEELGEIRVPRVVGVYGVGRVLNAKTARSQMIGGVVWGVSMALMEKTEFDLRNGRSINANLAEYHVPVNADIGEIDITFLDERDLRVDPLGAKGVGEIGITGVAAAIANAVYHATGRRIRELPITPDKLIG